MWKVVPPSDWVILICTWYSDDIKGDFYWDRCLPQAFNKIPMHCSIKIQIAKIVTRWRDTIKVVVVVMH